MVAKRQEETLVIQASNEVQIISEISHSFIHDPFPTRT